MTSQQRGLRLILPLVILLLHANGCAYRERSQFQKAKSDSSVDTVRTFLKEWPDSKYRHEAIALLHDRLYRDAKAVDTIEAYKAFLTEGSGGKYADAAAKRIRVLQALQSIRGRLTKAEPLSRVDLMKKVQAMNDLRSLDNANELRQFIPALIEALRDPRTTLLEIGEVGKRLPMSPLTGEPIQGPVFEVSSTDEDGKSREVYAVMVGVRTVAALALEHVAGQKLGSDPQKWQAWAKETQIR